MLKLTADWDKSYRTIQALKEDLNITDDSRINWEVGGWFESDTDTLLLCVMDMTNTFNPGVKGYKYHIQCWNSPGIRAAIGELLGLPVQRLNK